MKKPSAERVAAVRGIIQVAYGASPARIAACDLRCLGLRSTDFIQLFPQLGVLTDRQRHDVAMEMLKLERF